MTMLLQVKNQQNKLLANLVVEQGAEVKFMGELNKDFGKFLSDSLKKGIASMVHIPTEGSREGHLVEQGVKQSSGAFPPALKAFLLQNGYSVIEKYPGVEEEIKKLLEKFPDDNPDRADILTRLPEMTHLEQTAILEGLRNLDNQE